LGYKKDASMSACALDSNRLQIPIAQCGAMGEAYACSFAVVKLIGFVVS
jgi:hypothetical protein